MTSGSLYIVATPIGNLEDITLRALRTLKEVALIAAEDTRQTRKLLTHYDIPTKLTSYHSHNALEKAPVLMEKIREGLSIALVSDAGTPGISDPGAILVSECLKAGILVVPIPGASAVTASLPVSGLPSDRFVFEGFLPQRAGERRKRLERLKHEEKTLVFFEAPHRIAKTLEEMSEIFGDREATICREVTKLHEEMTKSTLGTLLAGLKGKRARGEITLVVAGAQAGQHESADPSKQQNTDEESLLKALRLKIGEGMDKKEAVKDVARETGASRNAVYAAAIKL